MLGRAKLVITTSTLGYNVAYCVARVMKWLLKQARHGFQGVTGSFE